MKKIIFISIIILVQLFKVYGQSDTTSIKNIVYEWTEAHNTHNLDKFEKLYDTKLLFYCKELSKEECLKLKSNLLQKSPNFQQKIVSNIEITYFESGIIKCDFTKEVFLKRGAKNYPSYLLLKIENGNYLIVGESDKITDANLKYNLNLGKQINILPSDNNHYFKYILIGATILVLFILIYFIIIKSKNKISKNENITQTIIEKPIQNVSENRNENIYESATESIIENSAENTTNSEVKKIDLQAAKDAGLKGLKVTGRFMNKVLDFADSIDRFFCSYGGKLKWFVGLSFLTVVGAPVADWLFNVRNDRLTAWSTIFLFFFLIILSLAWIGSLRDDEGNLSFKRFLSRIRTYLLISYDFITDSFSKSREEMLYHFSKVLIIVSFCLRALQNVSVFIRIKFNFEFLRHFENFTKQCTFWTFIFGIILFILFIYLIIKNKKILNKHIDDYFPFLTSKGKPKIENTQIQLTTNDLVINSKDKEQIGHILNAKNPELFNDFIKSLQKWYPRNCTDEDDFQNSFHRNLKRNIPYASIEREYRIETDKTDRRKDRKADIVINGTILIEMKKDFQVTATDRATTQVWNYSELWGDKGPVILLLCEANYEQAKNIFNPKLNSLAKLDRKIIAFVAKPK